MNWYYESAGQQQGPVTDTDLERLLAEGKITLDTLVWREGMSGWTPFRAVRTGATAAPSSVPPMDPGLEVTRPAQPHSAPSPTAGSDVPQPGWIRCSLTGRYFPPSEIIYLEGKPYSAAAKPQVIASLQSGSQLPGSNLDRTGPAWEQRQTLGFVKAIVETIKAVLLDPVRCFATMKRTGGLGTPLIFAIVTGMVGIVASVLYQVVLQGIAGSMTAMGGNTPGAPSAAMMFGTGIGALVGMVILGPIILVIVHFVWAGIIHLCLMMLKGANQPYETTFRAVCYSYGAGAVFNIIPMCGGYIGGIWALVALCIGLGKAHDTTTGKGVGAVLIPIGVCCLAVFAFWGIMFGAIMTAASGAR